MALASTTAGSTDFLGAAEAFLAGAFLGAAGVFLTAAFFTGAAGVLDSDLTAEADLVLSEYAMMIVAVNRLKQKLFRLKRPDAAFRGTYFSSLHNY